MPWLKGKPRGPLSRARKKQLREIALARGFGKWMTGKRASLETREKMSASQQLIWSSPAQKRKMSRVAKLLGFGRWMNGKPCSSKVIAKNKERRGKTYEDLYGQRAGVEKSKRRLGNRRRWVGIPRKPARPRHNGDYRYGAWRAKVFARDNFVCQVCNRRGGKLEAHHIKPWAKYPALRFITRNGLTVHAGECHRKAA